MKAVAYAGTRNLYPDMVTAAKSLAINSSVDEIWFLIEDDVFPQELPHYIHCMNVSDQKFFSKFCPNILEHWTYMVLMRSAYSKMFPQYDRILSLDVDTIVDGNIDELWELDLNDYYLAGVPEPLKCTDDMQYVNMGVSLFNLKKLREDKMDDKVIEYLNWIPYKFPEQDCINNLCKGQILTISSIYNANDYTEPCDNPKIAHFANRRDKWRDEALVLKYRYIPWSDIRRPICDT